MNPTRMRTIANTALGIAAITALLLAPAASGQSATDEYTEPIPQATGPDPAGGGGGGGADDAGTIPAPAPANQPATDGGGGGGGTDSGTSGEDSGSYTPAPADTGSSGISDPADTGGAQAPQPDRGEGAGPVQAEQPQADVGQGAPASDSSDDSSVAPFLLGAVALLAALSIGILAMRMRRSNPINS
jgi:hypothetical protein